MVEHIRTYEELGFDAIALHITSWNQRQQLERFITEVLPHFPQSAGTPVATGAAAGQEFHRTA